MAKNRAIVIVAGADARGKGGLLLSGFGRQIDLRYLRGTKQIADQSTLFCSCINVWATLQPSISFATACPLFSVLFVPFISEVYKVNCSPCPSTLFTRISIPSPVSTPFQTRFVFSLRPRELCAHLSVFIPSLPI